ncbi:hypothetical protein NPIL_703791 [Nephila pilipes]|uniref:Uncharacterized protein n=1 Tax=Nephila pilipes TaxID=299642 RepID=A0A8X6QV51_NEPPI|nr:hypothetical protein NPIL_703791 [Nephila pilipes]
MISLLRKIYYDWISSRVQHTPVLQKLFTILITLGCSATRSRTRQMCRLMEGCEKTLKLPLQTALLWKNALPFKPRTRCVNYWVRTEKKEASKYVLRASFVGEDIIAFLDRLPYLM